MDSRFDGMTADELQEQLRRLKDNLCDIEDLHSFTFNKSSLHIGAETAQHMQTEFEEECAAYRAQIAEIEQRLQAGQGQEYRAR